MLTEGERYFYDRRRYGSTAAKVDLCMAHTARPCRGGECDDTGHCERHARTVKVVGRLTRKRATFAEMRAAEDEAAEQIEAAAWRARDMAEERYRSRRDD